MKKICFILPSLGMGGAERVASHVLNYLKDFNFELHLIIIYKEHGEFVKFLDSKIKCHFLEKEQIRFSLFSLYRELRKIQPDKVVIFSFDLAILVGVFFIPLFPKIYFINRQINILGQLKLGKLKMFLLKKAYKNFDKIITQSQDMTLNLLNCFNLERKKIIEINNPVDIERITAESSKNKLIELDSTSKKLLCVGRLEKQKGFDLIIPLMKDFIEDNIKLYIIGEGSQRKELEILISTLHLEEKVFLLGKKENPYIYMKEADLFILSSRYEGFPNALIEALGLGLYSICNNILGGVNEIIIPHINGVIVNFQEKEKLKNIIKSEIYSCSQKDKKLIISSVKDRYDISIIANQYRELLEQVEE